MKTGLLIDILKKKSLQNKPLTIKEARQLITLPSTALPALIAAADEIRRKFKGNKVTLCGIVNARSGRCSEDCSFCAQSAHFKTSAPSYPLKSEKEILCAAQDAEKHGSNCFSIVTSGKNADFRKELPRIIQAIKLLKKKTSMRQCASLGTLSLEQAHALNKAGLKRFHHNLETARSFFNKVCTTHSYDERIITIRNAKTAGLEVCSGGIIGLGESPAQRVELAMTLRELYVDSVPINILNPIAGTPAAQLKHKITPLEVLQTIAVFRFILPKQDIVICGGREVNLRDLQAMVFWAGANGILVGNYLTTTGRDATQDVQLVKDLLLSHY